MNDMTARSGSPEELRKGMVDHIVDAGHAHGPVEQAMRTVPRHRFVPAATVKDAYADIAVITKRATNGAALSCASVPSLVATMLDQLDVHPGHRILEIGAGTGYNAALLAHLTGPSGQVTTVDIDAEVTAQAWQNLDASGYEQVRVITRDGALGAEEHGPYDRIIVTVGAWDIPTAWWNQLTPGGRLVVPLRWRGQTRSIAFVHEGDRMRSDSLELCGFVPMIGLGEGGEHAGHIDPEHQVTLYFDSDQSVNPDSLAGVLIQPRTEAWSGVTVVADESFDGVWLRLTGTEPGTCRLAAEPTAVDAGVCTPAVPARTPALVEDDSLAYFALRRNEKSTEPRWELGAYGHGPAGTELANRICKQIQAWGYNRNSLPVITLSPARTPHLPSPGDFVIDKRDSQLILSW